jgi:hypothetical protein
VVVELHSSIHCDSRVYNCLMQRKTLTDPLFAYATCPQLYEYWYTRKSYCRRVTKAINEEIQCTLALAKAPNRLLLSLPLFILPIPFFR